MRYFLLFHVGFKVHVVVVSGQQICAELAFTRSLLSAAMMQLDMFFSCKQGAAVSGILRLLDVALYLAGATELDTRMVVFSVFGGTGTTLQLCWQGFIGLPLPGRLEP